MLILLITVLIFLLYLIYERILLNRWINSIPLRISVTGTRGKSSVVRILASILRENGKKVLAKTTGSEAKYILPDGNEIEVPRRGITSIIEQKKLLKKAASLQVDCVVAEIMSIHPENHFVESHQMLKPNIVIITNIRLDHTDVMGKTKDEIAAVFCLDIPQRAKVFIPEAENRLIFQDHVKNTEANLISVNKGCSSSLKSDSGLKQFSNNLDLVYAVANYLNIEEKNISAGIRRAKLDIGQLQIWKYQAKEFQKTTYFVNAYAANDPESTFHAISKINKFLPLASDKLIGLLSLRKDRGDRTRQWIEALKSGSSDYFSKIFVMGNHAKIVKRKIKCADVLKEHSPEIITNTILKEIEDQAVIFGFGNIGGTGKLLVDYWNQIGEEYGI